MPVKISALPAASALTGAELVAIVQGGVTDQTTAAAIAASGVPATMRTSIGLGNAATNAAGLTAFTPSPASSSGTITTLGTIVANYRRTGNLIEFYLDFTITTNGTGAGAIIINLPVAGNAATPVCIVGREIVLTGKTVTGVSAAPASTIAVQFYDGTYPGGNTARIILSGTYSA